MTVMYFDVQPDPASISDAITRALESGSPSAIAGLDGLHTLEAATIAALVSGLRRLREAGGTIVLVASRPELLRTLAITGLDHVFTVKPSRVEAEIALAPKPASPSPVRALRSAVAGFLAFALLTFSSAAPVKAQPAQDDLTPQQVLERVIERNPNLNSYRARVHVDVHMSSFPFLAPKLDGTTYFKKPDNFEVVFDKVPSYAKGFEKIFSDVGDPAVWLRRFTMTREADETVNGHKDIKIRMVLKQRGMIDHQDVFIDKNAFTIDALEYTYYNGGHIRLTQGFRQEGPYIVLDSQRAEIAIPYAKAVATSKYMDYQTNVAIDDSVFTRQEKKAQ